jgi:hypothetical protein
MAHVGRVVAIGDKFWTLEDGGWVAETARFSETLATGTLNEFERAPGKFFVAIGGIIMSGPGYIRYPKKRSKRVFGMPLTTTLCA